MESFEAISAVAGPIFLLIFNAAAATSGRRGESLWLPLGLEA